MKTPLKPVVLAAIAASFAAMSSVLIAADNAAMPPSQSKVGDVKAVYREGQVFVTFKELDDAKGEKYAIYRAGAAVTPETLAKAEKVGTVGKDSGSYGREKACKVMEGKTKVPGYNQRYIIQDNPTNDPKAMLPEGVGLFVLTVKKPGKSFYAVVPVLEGKEEPSRLGAQAEAVDEKVQLPGAVLVYKNEAGTGCVYTHWMDGQTWDPFNEGNAYNFGVAVPKDYDGKKPLPVMFYGHGMGERYSAGDQASYWPCLWVWPCDKTGSWFLGEMNAGKTKVVNYVEQRVRWMAAWVKAERPNQFFKVDPLRFQAHGHSMGGTFCNALAMRMGDIFCTTVSSAGATIHRRNKTWVDQAAGLWGKVDQNLPLLERLWKFTDAGLSIAEKSDMGVWDYQDYGKWSMEHMGAETAFLLLSNGKSDGSVVFEPVPDFLEALQKSKRPFAADWDGRGHSNKFFSVKNDGMGAFRLPLNESLPAFANASNNGDIRKDGSGTINGKLEWCASGNDFDTASKDDDLVDTPEMYALCIRSLTGPATVDVTPRRLQKFKSAAGKEYAWENIDYSDPASPKMVADGRVTADKYGLVTVEKFAVDKPGYGHRLVIKPAK